MTDRPSNGKEEAFIVADENCGMRLDSFIAAQMPDHVSRSRIKEIIKQGGVVLDGKSCDSPNYRIKPGENIALEIPEPTEAVPKPENIPLEILHEDGELLVVNKPAGMVVHPAIGNWSGTLVNALLYHCGESLSGIGGVKRPGIVHRLDKDTSGLLVVAKTEKSLNSLSAQFADHGRTGELEREYLALVWGAPSPSKGTIETWLARSNSNRAKRAVVSQSRHDAKLAITHYEVKKACKSDDGDDAAISLVSCRLETGRTHQIRVHMSHIGHPLIGDQHYGKHFQTKLNALPDPVSTVVGKFRRQALHAAILGFKHPGTGDILLFKAEPPPDFQNLMDNLF